MSASFTCISCRVAFKDSETQRLHYKSEWHRYNLKRKVAELPPITSEEFKLRVLQQCMLNEQNSQDKSVYCQICRKSFTNEKAYENHLNSKKHKENEKNPPNVGHVLGSQTSQQSDSDKSHKSDMSKANAKHEEMEIDESCFSDSDIEEVDSDEWEDDSDNPIDNNDCLFCSHHSRSLVRNLRHMTKDHTFFIPDVEYCTDIRGLLRYLGDKINQGFMCLWCNEKGRTFHSADAARSHMLDKGHCKMLHEGLALAEYADYYDYSSSYPDAEEGVDKDEEVVVPEIEGSDYQLILPSGAIVGHRSLMRYYKQSIDPNRAVVVSNNSKKLHKVLAQYRSLGWSATQQDAAAKKARDIHYMKRLQSKYNMKLGMLGNKLQKHYRQQVNF